MYGAETSWTRIRDHPRRCSLYSTHLLTEHYGTNQKQRTVLIHLEAHSASRRVYFEALLVSCAGYAISSEGSFCDVLSHELQDLFAALASSQASCVDLLRAVRRADLIQVRQKRWTPPVFPLVARAHLRSSDDQKS